MFKIQSRKQCRLIELFIAKNKQAVEPNLAATELAYAQCGLGRCRAQTLAQQLHHDAAGN